jgi:hypothetical protein
MTARQVANPVGSATAYNFLPCDRDQGFLLPPDLRDWLPAEHLAWFILDVVDQLERRCREDIAFRVLSDNTTPDHVTIARFRVRHEQALAGLLVQSLKLCAAAGMVRLGLVALDGTKIEANAAATADRTHAHLEAQVAEDGRRQIQPSSQARWAAACRELTPSLDMAVDR